MFRLNKTFVFFAVLVLATLPLASPPAGEVTYGHGRPLPASDLAAWDIDVRYDGAGLPEGSGTVAKGEEIFTKQCAGCHGAFGEGAGRIPALFGGVGTLDSDRPERRVGGLWPYAPILFDYIRRAMPFGDAQSLAVDEIYSLTALVLNMNDLWDEQKVLNKANLPGVMMPNREGFVANEPGSDTSNTPCMRDCGPKARIVSRAELINNSAKP